MGGIAVMGIIEVEAFPTIIGMVGEIDVDIDFLDLFTYIDEH